MIRINYTNTAVRSYQDDEVLGFCTIKKISPIGPHYFEDIILEITYTDPAIEVIAALTY